MNFTLSGILAGLIFGTFGIYFVKHGRREAHIESVLIGIALMAYPYFVENDFLLWGIGVGLLFVGYRMNR